MHVNTFLSYFWGYNAATNRRALSFSLLRAEDGVDQTVHKTGLFAKMIDAGTRGIRCGLWKGISVLEVTEDEYISTKRILVELEGGENSVS